MRFFRIVPLLFLAACMAPQAVFGPQPYSTWMRKAILERGGKDPRGRLFYAAYYADPTALHTYFMMAYRLASLPEPNLIGSEALTYQLQTIIQHTGDRRFARALATELPEVCSAVALHLPVVALSRFPLTAEILSNAPNVEFPMIQAYRLTKADNAQTEDPTTSGTNPNALPPQINPADLLPTLTPEPPDPAKAQQ